MTIKKKLLQTASLNSKTVFYTLIFLITFWILSRPLKVIGEKIYHLIGSTTYNLVEDISKTKSNLNELIAARNIISEQNKKIALLNIKISSVENNILENKTLENLLKLQRNFYHKTIPASIIGRTTDNWHKQAILDKGKKDKVKIGDSVLSQSGIIGQIVKVNKNNSIVQLISDPAFKAGCKIKNKNITGILKGETSSVSILEFIPVGTKVSLGDKVVTSGIRASNLPPTYPPGYPIGKITKISKKKNIASDLYIEVKLFENLTKLSKVIIFSPEKRV